MPVGVRLEDRQRDVLVSFLRRVLVDLEDGKVVRVALDLQSLIGELEDQGSVKPEHGTVVIERPKDKE